MIRSIQSLRAVAALCVLFVSCGSWFAAEYPGRFENPFLLCHSGVDLFFIISGFIMLHSIHSAPHMDAGLFMSRRIIRIVPLYWLVTALGLSLALFLPQLFTHYRIDPRHALFSFLFIPQDTLPVIRTGWTLGYEMYFYLVLAAFLKTGLRSKIHWAAAFFAVSSFIGLAFPHQRVHPLFNMLASELLAEFAMGMLLFYAYDRGLRTGVPLALGLILSGLALLPVLDGSTRLAGFGLPMACIFSGVIFCRREMLDFRALHLLGDASYSLYLIQVLAVPACGKVVRMLPFDGYPFWAPLMGFFLAANAAVALCLHFTLERPLTERLKRGLRGTQPAIEARTPLAVRSASGDGR